MWVFVAEALGALSLLLMIVWWTLGPTQRREQDELRRLVDDDERRTLENVSKSEASKVDDASRER